ncbi:MAG: hypothetical protein CMG78_09585 [Marinobacter sp.]|nr:hypothetical protein [Marinobacter sp.]|tara:strand:- start:4572 stop:4970 length:399 start_codon:yes stop_codon:yes gene_type:complete
MTFNDIEEAVGQRLEGMANVPAIAWPNRAFKPDSTAYLEFRHSPGDRVDPVLAGGDPRQTGIFLITVVAPPGKFSGAANTLAQAVADRFPKGLRLTAGSGKVVINAPSSLATPFQGGGYWRQPVRVFYITET